MRHAYHKVKKREGWEAMSWMNLTRPVAGLEEVIVMQFAFSKGSEPGAS
ncbi:hypothetical protein TMEC54S_03302 [Thauera mechernichensis]